MLRETILQTGLKRQRLCIPVLLTAGLLTACAAKEDPATANGNQLGAVQYVVKTGDNLVLIAADVTRERENWRRIADFNRIANPATLKVGQTILIPKDLVPLTNNPDGCLLYTSPSPRDS